MIERARKSDEDEDEEAEADEDEEERVRINDKVMVTAKGSDRKGDVGIGTRLIEEILIVFGVGTLFYSATDLISLSVYLKD